MDIDKLVALIKKNIYKNHKQQVTASLVQEAVVATALEIGVSHRELLEALKESDGSFSEELKRYYTKDEANTLLDDKVDKEGYNQDLDAVNNRINASDAGVSKNRQELNGIKKLLGEAADSSKVVGTAKGGGVIAFPSNVLTNASPRYRVEGATDDEFKSVQTPMRVKSVGENLFNYLDGKNHTGSIVISGENITSKALLTVLFVDPSSLPSGERIYFYFECSKSDESTGSVKFALQTTRGSYNASSKFWDITGPVSNGDSFLVDVTDYADSVFYMVVRSYTSVKNIFISTTGGKLFIPYEESLLYFGSDAKLGSIYSIKDYIENNKLYQNIKRHYFSKSDEWALRDDYEGGNFRYYMTLPFEYKATGAGVENELLCNNFTATSNVASVLTERESNTIALYRENASTIYLTLDKKVGNVNDIIPEGTFIDVILPQTEVTNLDTSGMVVARPNGTVFIEPVANLTAFYDNGLDVSKLVIEEVESFSTFKDGNYQELDASKVSIKDGKLTHPDAVNGLCYLVYRHDNAPIYGNNEVDYYNSEKTLKSPNGKVWKKVEEATDDGELVTKLEEVK